MSEKKIFIKNNQLYIESNLFINPGLNKISLSCPIDYLHNDLGDNYELFFDYTSHLEEIGIKDVPLSQISGLIASVDKKFGNYHSNELSNMLSINYNDTVYIHMQNLVPDFNELIKKQVLLDIEKRLGITSKSISIYNKLKDDLENLKKCKDPDFIKEEELKLYSKLQSKSSIKNKINLLNKVSSLIDVEYPPLSSSVNVSKNIKKNK